MNTRASKILLLMLALVVAIAACSPSESTDTTEDGGSSETTQAGGESSDTTAPASSDPVQVVVLASDDPPNMDPHTSGGTEGGNIIVNVYDSLTTLSADLTETQPALATSWEAIDDLTWEFKLREDVTFHNGEPFNAEAVKFSADRILEEDPEVARITYSFPTLAGVEVVDEYTVRVLTTVPDPILPERMYSFRVVPPEYTSSVPESEFAMNPVGTGAFKFVEFEPGQQLVLEANEDYWNGAPAIDRLVFRPVPEPSTRVAELQTGGADIIQQAPVGQISEIESSEGARVEVLPGRRVTYIGMDLIEGGPEALQDKRVRQALNYAVDVDLILATVLEGQGARVATMFRPDFFGYDPSIEPYEYNPDLARQLLEEAGYEDGLSLTMQTSETIFPSATEVMQAITAQLADVGVDVTLDIVDHSTYRGIVIAGQEAHDVANLFAWNWGALEPSPDSPLSGTLQTGGISSYYSNSELDELIDAARQEMDPDVRADLYGQVQELLIEEAPFIFLYQNPDVYGVSDRVNFSPRLDQYVIGHELSVNE